MCEKCWLPIETAEPEAWRENAAIDESRRVFEQHEARRKADLERTKSDPILVVIDMQPKYSASNDLKTILQVARLIKKAKKLDQKIFFVEFGLDEHTHAPLIELVYDYGKRFTVIKNDMCGSKEIAKQCQISGFTPSELIVCGVNTDACVRFTVEGLARDMPGTKVTVVKRACNKGPNHVPWGTSEYNFEQMQNANRNVVFA